MMIGMIRIIPTPQMLNMMTTMSAENATSQFSWQFVTAEPDRPRPMATMMGPVTTGGKYLMTLDVPKARMTAARIR